MPKSSFIRNYSILFSQNCKGISIFVFEAVLNIIVFKKLCYTKELTTVLVTRRIFTLHQSTAQNKYERKKVPKSFYEKVAKQKLKLINVWKIFKYLHLRRQVKMRSDIEKQSTSFPELIVPFSHLMQFALYSRSGTKWMHFQICHHEITIEPSFAMKIC